MVEPVSTGTLLATVAPYVANVGLNMAQNYSAGRDYDRYRRRAKKEGARHNLIRALSRGQIDPQSKLRPKESNLTKGLGVLQKGNQAYNAYRQLQHARKLGDAQLGAAELSATASQLAIDKAEHDKQVRHGGDLYRKNPTVDVNTLSLGPAALTGWQTAQEYDQDRDAAEQARTDSAYQAQLRADQNLRTYNLGKSNLTLATDRFDLEKRRKELEEIGAVISNIAVNNTHRDPNLNISFEQAVEGGAISAMGDFTDPEISRLKSTYDSTQRAWLRDMGDRESEALSNVRSIQTDNLELKNAPMLSGAMANIYGGWQTETSLGDVAMINGYAKLQDPNSVNRPSEIKTIEEAQAWMDQFELFAGMDKPLHGRLLTPRYREFLVRGAETLYNQRRDMQIGYLNEIGPNYEKEFAQRRLPLDLLRVNIKAMASRSLKEIQGFMGQPVWLFNDDGSLTEAGIRHEMQTTQIGQVEGGVSVADDAIRRSVQGKLNVSAARVGASRKRNAGVASDSLQVRPDSLAQNDRTVFGGRGATPTDVLGTAISPITTTGSQTDIYADPSKQGKFWYEWER